MSRSQSRYESTAALAGRKGVDINAVFTARHPNEVSFNDETSTVTVEGKKYHFPRWIYLILMLSMAGCFQQAGASQVATETPESRQLPTETRSLQSPTPTTNFNELFAQVTQSAIESQSEFATAIAGATQSALETRQVLVNDAQHVVASETPTSTSTHTPSASETPTAEALSPTPSSTPEPQRPETVPHSREAVVTGNTAWEGVDLDSAEHSDAISDELVDFIQHEFVNASSSLDNTFVTNLSNPHAADLTSGNDRVTAHNEQEPGLGFTEAAVSQLSTVTGEARLDMPIEDVFVSNGAGTGENTTFSIGAAHDHQFSSLIMAAGMVFELHKEAILTSIAGVSEYEDGLTVEEFLTDPRFQSFRPEINGKRSQIEAEYICEVQPISDGERFRRDTTNTDVAFDGSNWMEENGYSASSNQWNATIVDNEPERAGVTRQDQVQTLRDLAIRDQNDDPESTTYTPSVNLGYQSDFTPIVFAGTLDIDGPNRGDWDVDAFSAGILTQPDGREPQIEGEDFAAMLNEIQRCGRRGERPTETPTETQLPPTGEQPTNVPPSDTPQFTNTVETPSATPSQTRTPVVETSTPAPTNTHEFTSVPSQTATRGVTPTDIPVEPTRTATTRPTATRTPVPTNTPTRVPPTETPRPTNTPTNIPPTETPWPTATRTPVPTNTPTRVPPTETQRPTNTATNVPPSETPWPTATLTAVPTEVQPTPTFAPTNTDVFSTLPPVEPTQGMTPTDIPIDG